MVFLWGSFVTNTPSILTKHCIYNNEKITFSFLLPNSHRNYCNEYPNTNLIFPKQQQEFSSKTSNNLKIKLLNVKDVEITLDLLCRYSRLTLYPASWNDKLFSQCACFFLFSEKSMWFNHHAWFVSYVIFTLKKKEKKDAKKEKYLNMKYYTLEALIYSKEGCGCKYIKTLVT